MEFNICCFDVHHLRVAENEVAGARTGPGDNGGYGIAVYATDGFPDSCHDVAVADNRVEDTEGSGIYFVRVTHAHLGLRRDRTATAFASFAGRQFGGL